MTFDKTRNAEWREHLKEKRREWQVKRRVALANDPRVLAIKQALKERRHAAYEKAKVYRKAIAERKKKLRREREAEQRAQRDAVLREKVHPATRR